MKNIILAITSLFTVSTFAATGNRVCQAKALALVTSVNSVDGDTRAEIGSDSGKVSVGKLFTSWTYNVEAQTPGAHMPMRYTVTVAESGPQACYLLSLAAPIN